MKKEMTLTAAPESRGAQPISATKTVVAVRRAMAAAARAYSRVLGTEVSARQAARLLNAQAAFVLTVFPTECPLALRAACLVWLVAALRGCRRLGIKVEE